MGDDPGRTVSCVPYGKELTLRGRIVVRPFGKGTDGAVLQVSAQEVWILTYRAQGVLLELDGAFVEVTGRACQKQFEAIAGEHFDLATLVVSDPPG
ncbi:MAG: hypothetical protein R6X02_27070 [Enhygromyxa sp.]